MVPAFQWNKNRCLLCLSQRHTTLVGFRPTSVHTHIHPTSSYAKSSANVVWPQRKSHAPRSRRNGCRVTTPAIWWVCMGIGLLRYFFFLGRFFLGEQTPLFLIDQLGIFTIWAEMGGWWQVVVFSVYRQNDEIPLCTPRRVMHIRYTMSRKEEIPPQKNGYLAGRWKLKSLHLGRSIKERYLPLNSCCIFKPCDVTLGVARLRPRICCYGETK